MKKLSENLIVKIILAAIFIILIPVAVNKLLLKEFFSFLQFDEDWGRALRGIISGLVMAPLLYAWFYSRFYREKLLELKPGNFISGLITGPAMAALILLPVILLFKLTGVITYIQPVRPEQFWYGLIMVLVLAATEELLFRGILYKIIEAKYSCPAAIAVTAVLFTLSHMANDNFTAVSVLSVVAGSVILGLMFTWGGSLWMPVAFHFAWNMIQVITGLPVSGLSIFSGAALFKMGIEGPELLTGGDFGIENSIVVIILIFAACLVVQWKIKREPAASLR